MNRRMQHVRDDQRAYNHRVIRLSALQDHVKQKVTRVHWWQLWRPVQLLRHGQPINERMRIAVHDMVEDVLMPDGQPVDPLPSVEIFARRPGDPWYARKAWRSMTAEEMHLRIDSNGHWVANDAR